MTAPLSELVAAVELPALVESRAGQGRSSGGRYLFQCPNPAHPDQHPSFTVWRTPAGKWRARCQSQCDWQGDALDLVQWLDGCTPGDAARTLRTWLGRPDDYTPRPPAKQAPRVRVVPEQTRTMPEHTAAAVMSRYLDSRGWPPSVVEQFGLSVVLDRWGRPRIRHPYHQWNPSTQQWDAVTYQDRATGDARPKWMTPAGSKLPPYNVRSLDSETPPAGVVICEGPADTITAALALTHRPDIAAIGVAGANGWQPGWGELLGSAVVILAADPDAAGQNLVRSVVADLGRQAACIQLRNGDLTDTARRHGLDAVTELLTAPVCAPPSSAVHTDTLQAEPEPEWVRWAHLEKLGKNSWLWCDTCHQPALTHEKRRCLMTPGCAGSFVAISEAVPA